MALPQVGSVGAKLGGGSRTTSAVPVPAGVAAGDLVLIYIYFESGSVSYASTSSTADFHQVHFSPAPRTVSVDTRQRVFWKRATGADTGTYDFTHGAAWTNAVAIRFTGVVASGTPFETLDSDVRESVETVSPSLSGTTSGADRLLIASATSSAGSAWLSPSGYTERFDSGNELSVATREQAAAGLTAGTSAFTASNAGYMTGTLLGILPADASTSATAPSATATATLKTTGVIAQAGSSIAATAPAATASATLTASGNMAKGSLPDNSITATPEPDATPPRIRLQVQTTRTEITLYRVAQDGTQTPVRSYDGGPFPVSSGTLVAYDPEAPIGLPVSYTSDAGQVANSGVVTLTADRVWLTHPGVPARSVPIEISALSERSYEANQSVRYPLGRRFPIIAHDGVRKAPTYDITILTETLDDMGDVESLLADMSPLLLQCPADQNWGQVSEYVSVGRVSQGRVVQIADHQMRRWTLACSVVGRPAGGSQADNTYAKSYGLYPTYADRYAAHATYGEAFDPQ